MLQIEIAADLLTNGRGKLLAIQAMIIWYAGTAPSGIRNMAKNLAPVFSVDTMIVFPMQEIVSKQMMWIERSPLFPDVYVATSEAKQVKNHIRLQFC
jgi:hypothetical protein